MPAVGYNTRPYPVGCIVRSEITTSTSYIPTHLSTTAAGDRYFQIRNGFRAVVIVTAEAASAHSYITLRSRRAPRQQSRCLVQVKLL